MVYTDHLIKCVRIYTASTFYYNVVLSPCPLQLAFVFDNVRDCRGKKKIKVKLKKKKTALRALNVIIIISFEPHSHYDKEEPAVPSDNK